MNLRREATEKGLTRYNSGKPCRRGHASDRYTSNGMCIECLSFHTVGKRDEFATAKAKRNIAQSESFRDHTVMVKQGHRIVLEELADILRYGDSEKIAQIIHAEYLASPTPRTLTRADLLTFMDFRDNAVHNGKQLELSHDEPLCIIRNGQHYPAEQCMGVLRGTRLNVKPVYKVNT